MKNLIVLLIAALITIFSFSKNEDINIAKAMNQSNLKELQISEVIPAQPLNVSDNLPQQEFPIKVSVGDEYSIDLDGDNIEDVVSYVLDTEKYERDCITTLSINGMNFAYNLEDLGVFMCYPHFDNYYIVDIDKSDNFKEIALLDEGFSDDPETYFLRYNGNDLEFIGSTPDFPSNPSYEFLGNGTIIASNRLNIFQTWWAPTKWVLNNNFLEMVNEDLYYPYSTNPYIEMPAVELLQDLDLYIAPDLNAECVTAAKGDNVTFISTDDEHWISMTTNNGTTGWFYVEDFSSVIINEESVDSTNIFSNLLFAD